MNDFLESLNDDWVRRLAWCCFSEPIIRDFTQLAPKITAPAFELHEQRRDWLRALDRQPAPLHDYLARHCRSPRLGLVFESLWHFFLREDADTTLLAHNLPVRDKAQTLGEFDVLYYCHRRQCHVHLELAVKFFMATAQPQKPGNLLSYWLGPNSRDRLDIKWRRLHQHQLALANTAQAAAPLREVGIDALVQEVLISGWLFHGSTDTPLHPALNPRHQRGRWMTRSAFLARHRDTLAAWRYLPKPEWLGHWAHGADIDDAILVEIDRRPIMLLHRDERHHRLMVAPDNWPASIG